MPMGTSPSEFTLIDRFFSLGVPSYWPSQGIGDDCAIVKIGSTTLAITTDTTALSTHFLPNANPSTVGYKALAVNLSDLAAAGSTPRFFVLAISLPEADEFWLQGFSQGLKRAAQEYGCALLGGDTTRSTFIGKSRSPVSVTITAIGEVHPKPLTRQGAKVGEDIWVSGAVGDAYAALMLRTGKWSGCLTDYLASRMDMPTPRVSLGQFLANNGIASACADVSDGLCQDLGHILERSSVGAHLWIDAPKVSDDLSCFSVKQRRFAQWAGGDDYELVFTAAFSHRQRLLEWSKASCVPLSRIGVVVEQGVKFYDQNRQEVEASLFRGFDHFRD